MRRKASTCLWRSAFPLTVQPPARGCATLQVAEMRDMSQRGCARRIPWHGHCFRLGMQWIVRMTERTGLAFAATVLALAIMQTATEGASARGYEDMTRLEQRVAEFASRSEKHTSELQSLMRISYAVFCLKKKIKLMYQKHRHLYPRQNRTTT